MLMMDLTEEHSVHAGQAAVSEQPESFEGESQDTIFVLLRDEEIAHLINEGVLPMNPLPKES